MNNTTKQTMAKGLTNFFYKQHKDTCNEENCEKCKELKELLKQYE